MATPAALDAAVAIRKLFDGKQLVPGVKALIAHIHDDAGWSRVQPPLSVFPAQDRAAVSAAYDSLRAAHVPGSAKPAPKPASASVKPFICSAIRPRLCLAD